MVRKKDQYRMREMLSEAITVLCKASLEYRWDFTIEGLLGITLDNEEIFLININQHVQKETAEAAHPSHPRESASRSSSLHSSSHQRTPPLPSSRGAHIRKRPALMRWSPNTNKQPKTDHPSDPIHVKEEYEDNGDYMGPDNNRVPPFSPQTNVSGPPFSKASSVGSSSSQPSPQRHSNSTNSQVLDSKSRSRSSSQGSEKSQHGSSDALSQMVESVTGENNDGAFVVQPVSGIDGTANLPGSLSSEDFGSHLSLSAESSSDGPVPGCSSWPSTTNIPQLPTTSSTSLPQPSPAQSGDASATQDQSPDCGRGKTEDGTSSLRYSSLELSEGLQSDDSSLDVMEHDSSLTRHMGVDFKALSYGGFPSLLGKDSPNPMRMPSPRSLEMSGYPDYFGEQDKSEMPRSDVYYVPGVVDEEPTRGKRQFQPHLWKKNMSKELRNAGKEYINVKGETVPARSVKPKDCSTCRYKCNEKVPEKKRWELFTDYWALPTYQMKRDYIADHVVEEPTKKAPTRKAISRVFYLDTDTGPQRVCKAFFLLTLDVGEKMMQLAVQKKYMPLRSHISAAMLAWQEAHPPPMDPQLFQPQPPSSSGDDASSL